MCSMTNKFMQMPYDFGTNHLVLHAKRIVHSSIAAAYQSTCDYPMVLGAGILLLLLHRICPPLLAFLVSSSPLFLLTGLLLGALLSYAEPSTPSMTGEGTSDNQQILSPNSKISIADCSSEEVESVTIETRLEKRTGSAGVYVGERAPANNTHDNHCQGTNVTFVVADTVLSTESSTYAQTNVIVGREEYGDQINEKYDLREFESSNNESGNYEVHNHYQLGESMSPCWQSADRQDHCYGSESDFTDESSSPDASMTDIIPMLEELHPLIDLGTGHPTLASMDNLNSSSDDDEDVLEDDDDDDSISYDEDEGEEEEKGDANNQEDMNSRADGLMELQSAKNILKFELDQRLMDLRTADGEIGGEDDIGSQSDSDAAKQGNDGKLSLSQEAHFGEEIKILSPAISDAAISKTEYGMHESDNNCDYSDDINSFPVMKNVSRTSEAEVSVHAGGERSVLCCLSNVNNSEQHVIDANSIDEVNSLFRCNMEEVLVQSVSEPIMEQPLTAALEDDSSDPALCSNPGTHAIKARSVEELNSQFIQINHEAPTCDACDDVPIQEKSSEAFPAPDEHTFEVPVGNGSRELSTAENPQIAPSSV